MYKWLLTNKNRNFLAAAIVLWGLYAVLTLLSPQPQNTYHLSRLEIGLMQLTIILPMLVIWMTAIFGAVSFRQYSHIIQQSADGKALALVSKGLLLVVAFFILQGILGVLPNYFVGTPLLHPIVAIANEAPMLVSLAAFVLILAGALKLRAIASPRLTAAGLLAIVFPYFMLAVIFAWNFYQSVPLFSTSVIPKFGLPGKMPFYTLALPYIAVWILGVLSVTIIAEYARTVNGMIYRNALKDLVRGLSGVLCFSILVQLLQLSSGLFTHMLLGGVLLVVYILVILYAVGFVFIARGAHKLIIIEQSL